MHFMPTATCDYVFTAITEHCDDETVYKVSTSVPMWLEDSMFPHCCHPSKHTHYFMPREEKSSTWLKETT